MIIVIDSNIFMSALIKDSLTRKLMVECSQRLLFPEIIFDEMRKHKNEIIKKSKLTKEEYEKLISKLLSYVEIIPLETIRQFRWEAKKIMEHIDPNDVLFIATALAYESAYIWSDDKHFQQQDKINIFTTSEMIHLFLDKH